MRRLIVFSPRQIMDPRLSVYCEPSIPRFPESQDSRIPLRPDFSFSRRLESPSNEFLVVCTSRFCELLVPGFLDFPVPAFMDFRATKESRGQLGQVFRPVPKLSKGAAISSARVDFHLSISSAVAAKRFLNFEPPQRRQVALILKLS